MKSFRKNLVVLAALAAMAVGCAGDNGLGLSAAELVPAGSNAAFVSNTVPGAMAPGERVAVSVTVTNTGTTPGVNDWTQTSPPYALYWQGPTSFGWVTTPVPSLTPVGSSATFNFNITAPTTPGTYNFAARMVIRSGGGFFGPVLSVPVTVTAGPAALGCTYQPSLSDVPTTLPPESNRTVTVALQNTGTQTWTAGTYYLRNRTSLWELTIAHLTADVAPGNTGTFTFSIRAPSTTGTHPFVWDMFQGGGGAGFFGQDCVNLAIDVSGAAELDSAVVSSTFPTTLAPSEARSVTITMQNTGTQTWTSGTAFALDAGHSPADLFGSASVRRYLTTTVAPGESAAFTFSIRAPATPGAYAATYRLRKMPTATDAGAFGDTFSTTVTVDGSATPALGCAYVPGSSTVPTTVLGGTAHSVTVAVQNTGTQTWAAGTVHLRSTNTPTDLWGPVLTGTLAAPVAPSEIGSFIFAIQAPTAGGTTSFVWDMYEGGGTGAGYFGTNCVNLSIDVTEATVDLALGADRTISGGGSLAPVTIADVNDDDVPDVLAARLSPPTGVSRAKCGVVYGFVGGSGFFTGTSTAAPADAAFAIVGAEADDQLGIYSTGNIVIGDITGDGVEDIIVGAPDADGPMNARASAGDVYVISGGLGLGTAGTIDLGATTAPAQLVATIHGAAVGDQLKPLAVGDLTGDGINDLVLGAPQTAVGASNIGAVYVVVGTATGLSGTIDLAAPGATVVHTIVGVATNDRAGGLAAIGNFMGDATLDLLLGSPGHTEHATRDGAAWGFAGPITGDSTVAAADATWIGTAAAVGLGSALAIGDVRGSASADVLIAAYQFRETPTGDQSGAVLVFTGPVAPGTYDMSVSFSSTSARILGADHGDNFGTAVSVGDIDGDGRADVVVGARAADGAGEARLRSGEVSVIRGGATLSGVISTDTVNPALLIYGPDVDGLTASYVNTVSVGDIDGDDRDDICIGSHKAGRVDCIRSPF